MKPDMIMEISEIQGLIEDLTERICRLPIATVKRRLMESKLMEVSDFIDEEVQLESTDW
jgi:hypothetical protein